MVLAALLALLVLITVAVAVRRLRLLRGGGAEVVLRQLPAPAGRGWRHGVVRYDEDELVFYRVASLRPGADRRVRRRTLSVLERRSPEASEQDVVPPGATVLRLSDERGVSEIALAGGTLTGFLAWMESSPPDRAERRSA